MNLHLTILFFVLSLSSFSRIHSATQYTSINKYLENVSPSYQDRVIANNIWTIYKVAKKNTINATLIKKAINRIKPGSPFTIYKDWLKELLKINSISNLAQVLKRIENINLNDPRPIQNKLNKQIYQIYVNKAISSITNQTFKKKNLIERFISNHFQEMTTWRNQREVALTLKRLKRNNKNYESLSKQLIRHFINHSKVPGKKILSEVLITPKLTEYIQVNGLDNIESSYIYRKELERTIQNVFDSEIEQNGKLIAVHEFQDFISKFKDQFTPYRQTQSLLRVAKHLTRNKLYDLSRSTLKQSKLFNLDEKYQEDIDFENLWSYLQQGDHASALRFIDSEGFINNYKTLSSKFMYWTSYVLQKNNRKKIADKIKRSILEQHPVSFYAILGAKDLRREGKIKSYEKAFFQDNGFTNLSKKVELSGHAINILDRLSVWSFHGYQEMIDLEQNQFAYSPKDKLYRDANEKQNRKLFSFLTASVHQRTENYLNSFKSIYPAINNKYITLDKEVLELLYPKPFRQIVTHKSGELEPIILLSLIRQESGFNPNAISRAGARGLMQLMPTTARQLRRRYISRKTLHNPKINVTLGAKYINYLYDKFENNLAYSLAAYNAGENRVSRWINEYLDHQHMLFNIEQIPFNETRNYVKLIYRNIFFYELMNGKKITPLTKQLYSKLITEN